MNRGTALRLRSGRGGVITPYLDRVFNTSNIQQLLWVSPWLTHVEFKTGDTRSLLRSVGRSGVRFTLVTREPDNDAAEHEEIVTDAQRLGSADVIYVDGLHAKFYICSATRRDFGIVGSANLYRWSERSYEVAVEIEGRGEGIGILQRLYDLGLELRTSGRIASL